TVDGEALAHSSFAPRAPRDDSSIKASITFRRSPAPLLRRRQARLPPLAADQLTSAGHPHAGFGMQQPSQMWLASDPARSRNRDRPRLPALAEIARVAQSAAAANARILEGNSAPVLT